MEDIVKPLEPMLNRATLHEGKGELKEALSVYLEVIQDLRELLKVCAEDQKDYVIKLVKSIDTKAKALRQKLLKVDNVQPVPLVQQAQPAGDPHGMSGAELEELLKRNCLTELRDISMDEDIVGHAAGNATNNYERSNYHQLCCMYYYFQSKVASKRLLLSHSNILNFLHQTQRENHQGVFYLLVLLEHRKPRWPLQLPLRPRNTSRPFMLSSQENLSNPPSWACQFNLPEPSLIWPEKIALVSSLWMNWNP